MVSLNFRNRLPFPYHCLTVSSRQSESVDTWRRASFQTPLQDEFSKKKKGEKMKTPTFFLPNSQSRVPGPSTASVFVQIILPSKWTGVSLKGSRRNWQETAPGEEKVNQLFNTNCNKWHFNRFLKDVQQSIIHLYLQKVTLQVIPQVSAISTSLKSPNLQNPISHKKIIKSLIS